MSTAKMLAMIIPTPMPRFAILDLSMPYSLWAICMNTANGVKVKSRRKIGEPIHNNIFAEKSYAKPGGILKIAYIGAKNTKIKYKNKNIFMNRLSLFTSPREKLLYQVF